jgi:hypothetical protein
MGAKTYCRLLNVREALAYKGPKHKATNYVFPPSIYTTKLYCIPKNAALMFKTAEMCPDLERFIK